jgi:hypothetical protein
MATTSSGQPSALSFGLNHDYIIIATVSNIQRLCDSILLSMDGTFDAAPKLILQLFSIHAFVSERLH